MHALLTFIQFLLNGHYLFVHCYSKSELKTKQKENKYFHTGKNLDYL